MAGPIRGKINCPSPQTSMTSRSIPISSSVSREAQSAYVISPGSFIPPTNVQKNIKNTDYYLFANFIYYHKANICKFKYSDETYIVKLHLIFFIIYEYTYKSCVTHLETTLVENVFANYPISMYIVMTVLLYDHRH